ncbi:glucose-6-phosphate isomerase [Actinomadura rudentiformis]|uniref:Glucose-6-phosphate isomerase n=1 Tax=Actinomadura rudentiformis TaxID=359158 RepID=A0A6H9Z5B5_9ACTN|nr:glucose-6-phosphate isomerase [Actinomadura rudentiformis]KAB2348853.1 glucose-6-phosphate isomerase [Actinomadura rudentiformis]
MTSVVTAGGVSVTIRGAVVDETETVLDRLVSDGVPGSLTSGHAGLWGPDAARAAARRLGWLDLPERSRGLLGRLAELVGEARGAGLDRIVLAGMGGSSLAPDVIARAGGAELTVLDTTDPHQVADVLADRLDRTLVVLSSKSGDTVEADAHRRVFERAFAEAGIGGADLRRRFVIVTDPGSPLEAVADAAGYRLVLADPNVGGRYGALSASGLVPCAVAGVDVVRLLDEAAALVPALQQPYDNPALALGAVLGSSALGGRDKLVVADNGSGLPGLDGWVEHLVAESTGKDGRGLLPVVVESVDAPGFDPAGDTRRIVLGSRPDEPVAGRDAELGVAGPLGAQFLLWEYATAVACRVLGVDPFDEPDVQESRDNTAALLRAEEGIAPTVVHTAPALVEGAVEVHARPESLKGAKDLAGVLEAAVTAAPDRGYLAVMAYLDRFGDASASGLRSLLAERGERLRKHAVPVTFGWGPQLLHTTGQYHKGGPPNGSFLQITGAVREDVEVPDRPYTLGQLQLAQAFGDQRVLRSLGRPAFRLHLRDRDEGIAQLTKVLTG